MTDLVFKGQNAQVLTNSLLVAEKFGKRHADVVRAIENSLTKGSESTNAKLRSSFLLSSYIDNKGEERPMYIMDRDGFSVIAMGFTGDKAMDFKVEFISAFNAMEKKLKELSAPQTYAEALRRLADEVEEKERTKALLEQKTEQLNESKEWYSIKRWAKEHNMNWRSINRRKMKALSYGLGYEIKKIFDANYGRVNIYHVNVFKTYFQ